MNIKNYKSNSLYVFLWKVYHVKPMVEEIKDVLKNISMRYCGYVIKASKTNSKFYLPYYKTDLIQSRIYNKNDYFERENLDYVCKGWNSGEIGKHIKNGSILDIGANIGNHTLYFCNEMSVSRCYCFEPIKSTYKIFQKNVQVNNLEDKVTLYKVAVGSKKGKAILSHYNVGNIGETSIKNCEDGEIPVVSIDEMRFDTKISLIKIDVEGFELEVIKGMQDTLRNNKPYVMVEIRDEYIEEALDIFEASGLEHIVVKDFCQFGYKDYLFYPSK